MQFPLVLAAGSMAVWNHSFSGRVCTPLLPPALPAAVKVKWLASALLRRSGGTFPAVQGWPVPSFPLLLLCGAVRSSRTWKSQRWGRGDPKFPSPTAPPPCASQVGAAAPVCATESCHVPALLHPFSDEAEPGAWPGSLLHQVVPPAAAASAFPVPSTGDYRCGEEEMGRIQCLLAPLLALGPVVLQ